jgi:hypothetical protein
MDHEHRNRRNQHLIVPAIAMTDAAEAARPSTLTVTFPFVVPEHVIDLCRRKAVAAGAVHPDGDVARTGSRDQNEKEPG